MSLGVGGRVKTSHKKINGSSLKVTDHFVNCFNGTYVESGLEWREMDAGKKLERVFYKGLWKKKKKKVGIYYKVRYMSVCGLGVQTPASGCGVPGSSPAGGKGVLLKFCLFDHF